MALLEPFLESMSSADAPTRPDDVARLLARCVVQACSDLDLHDAEVFSDRSHVTIFPTYATAWEVVVEKPDAYQLYPGVLKENGETIVWVQAASGESRSLAAFVDVLEQELSAAASR